MQRKLDLRTGRPVWLAYRAPAVPAERLKRDIRTEILVIGMGISGAMVAETLTARGHDVVCIDRRGPTRGSTSASTALVQFEIDQPLSTLKRQIGAEAAIQAWRRSRLAVESLAARVAHLGVAPGASRHPSLLLAGDSMDAGELEAEAAVRRAAGVHAIFLDRKKLSDEFGLKRDGAILSHANIALDPRKLTARLLLKASERGARLFAPVEALSPVSSRDEVIVATASGPTIRAAHVVLATGYELMDLVPGARHEIVSTWAIATRPQKRALWPQSAFIWEASDPYLYMRATDDGRVICGGEDEPFSDEEKRDALIGEKSETIAAKLAALLPGLDTRPDFAWAGAFGTTTTGLPRIGAIPGKPRIFAVLGYGGNGITYSQIASEIIDTTLVGGKDADAEIYAFSR